MADNDPNLSDPSSYDLVPVDHTPQFADAPIPKAGQTVQQPNVMGDISSMPGKVASAVGDVTGVTDAYKAATGQMTPEEAQMFALGALPMLAGGPEAKVAEELAPGAAKTAKGIVQDIADYAGEHGAPDMHSGSPLHDVTQNGTYPADFYSGRGLQYYAPGHDTPGVDAGVYHKIVATKDQPDQMVNAYRAIPWEGKRPQITLNSGGPSGAVINPGDWVTLSRQYAKDHGESALNGQYAIVSKKVPARELFTNGDSFHEWGWDPRASQPQEPTAPPQPQGIRAYHGSPYDFNQFDLSKIGTGEGAQAYGHGVYLAENPSTADVYRKTLSLKGQAEPQAVKAALGDAVPYDPQIANAIRSVAMSEPDPTRAAFLLQSRVPDLRDEGMSMLDNDAPKRQALSKAIALEQEAIKGHMYEVNINADPEHFLDWDKPLSEQSPKVQQALKDAWLAHPEAHANQTGEQIYRNAEIELHQPGQGHLDRAVAAQKLAEAGIPGIKYLDQGSRIGGDAGKMIDNYGSREKALEVAQQRLKSAGMGDLRYWDGVVNQLKTPQTNNFVVFNDKLINIVKKYGLAGLVAGGASHFSTVPVDHQPDFGGQQQGMATGGSVKSTKTQANYRGGNKDARCYMCTMFVRPDGCTAVQGKISARGLCDFFKPKGKKKNTVKIDATHDGPWMSCMSIDGSTMYRNRNIPATANVKGKTVDVDDMLLHHEVPERADLEKLIAEFKERFHREPNTRERKGIYLKAHNRSGTPNERAHAKNIGVDWKAWSAWCRGEESKIEKMKFTNEPKDADVKPIPHSHGDLEAEDHASAA